MSTSYTVFLTGATGFVGGTILSCLQKAHPEIHVKALTRHEETAKELRSIYPNLSPVIGELSSLALLTSTAAEADFVIHAGGDNVPAVCAMIDGLASRNTTATTSPRPRLISLTGPRSLIDLSIPITGKFRADSLPWSDVTDAQAIFNLHEDRMHAGADQAIVAHSIAKGIGTLLVSPGQLWGRGKGPLKKESNSAFYYAAVKSRGRAFVVGDGTATWSWCSIGDLGAAVVFLMEQSLGIEGRGGVGVNRDGYYFVRTGDLSMIDRAEAVSERLGLGEVESVSVEAAKEIHPFGHIMWGCGERIRPDKLAALGWTPSETDWKALMEEEGGERA